MSEVSVIIPVYNTEQYLPRCLDSILSQSFSDFELLLIDDGSTDCSGAICDGYAEKDSRIRVFHKKNGGVSSARNLGLKEAKGEWIYFVDSDDEVLPEGLQIMVNSISEEVDIVMAGYEKFDEKGKQVYSIKGIVSKIITSELAIKEMYEPSVYWYQGYIWNKLIRKEIIRDKGICFAEDVYFNEDRLFLTHCICVIKKKVFFTTIPVYKYYERSGGAVMSLRKDFNPKFVTDLEARIRMRDAVKSRYGNDELTIMADYEVYKGVRRIYGLMQEYCYLDTQLKSRLRTQLVNAIGYRRYLKFEIQRDKRRVLKKLRKLFHLNE